MDAVQTYQTTIHNRGDGRAFSFVTVPKRSLLSVEVPAAHEVASGLDLRDPRDPSDRPLRIKPVEAWNLPFLIDAATRHFVDYPYEFGFYFDPDEPRARTGGRGPTPFAQYLAYAPVVPFESSPLAAQSLAELIASNAEEVTGALGRAATGDPLLLLAVPAGIIVCGAARGIGEALRIGLRARLLELMGVEDPEASGARRDPPDDPTVRPPGKV